jgi:hypothetical protein
MSYGNKNKNKLTVGSDGFSVYDSSRRKKKKLNRLNFKTEAIWP